MAAAPENQRSSDTDSNSESEVVARHEPIHDSILNIIGIGASEQETDIARYKQEYIADAIESKREP